MRTRILLLSLLLAAVISLPTSDALAGQNQFKLTWTDNSTNEALFKIERAPVAAGPFAQIATVGADIATFTDLGLPDSTQFCYRVRASNAGGDSAYTNVFCGTTNPPLIPNPPSNLTGI